MTDIVDRLNDIWRDDDHERGCQGREYTCSCGFDERTLATAKEAADTITTLRSRIGTLEKALKPFAGAVFNDNGDISVDMSAVDAEKMIQAYFALRRSALSEDGGGE